MPEEWGPNRQSHWNHPERGAVQLTAAHPYGSLIANALLRW